jgi:hypothetical protein
MGLSLHLNFGSTFKMDIKDLFDKLSSYNIFNYLLPGAAFCMIAERLTELKFVQEDLLNAFFVYYLIGMIISRIGSTIIEPVLKKIKFVKFSDYGKYIDKSKEDPLLATLSEQNNTYRTLLSMFILLLIVDNINALQGKFPWLDNNMPSLALSSMVVLLAFSYRKQTNFITNRIEK